jgi:hypothetical protein
MRIFVCTQQVVNAQGLFISVRIGDLFLFPDPAIRMVAGTWRADLDGDLHLAGPPGIYPGQRQWLKRPE